MKKIDALLSDLNNIGTDFNRSEFGLPLHSRVHVDIMHKIVNDYFLDNLPLQNNIEIDCFEVYEIDVYNAYKRIHIAYVTTQAIAMNLCTGNHYRGYAPYKKSYKIRNSVHVVAQDERELKMEKIKEKLSQDELELLGLV